MRDLRRGPGPLVVGDGLFGGLAGLAPGSLARQRWAVGMLRGVSATSLSRARCEPRERNIRRVGAALLKHEAARCAHSELFFFLLLKKRIPCARRK